MAWEFWRDVLTGVYIAAKQVMRVIVIYLIFSLLFCVKSAFAHLVYIPSFKNLIVSSNSSKKIDFNVKSYAAGTRPGEDDYLSITAAEVRYTGKKSKLNASPPVAVNDDAKAETNIPLTFSVVENDSDPDGKLTLDLTSVDLDPATPGIQVIFVVAGQGTYTTNNNGTVTFTPVAGYKTGQFTATPISYTIKDNTGLTSNSATITMMVNPKTAPVANPDEASTTEDTNVSFNLIANDTDLNGNNTIDITSVDLDAAIAGRQNSITVPGQGSFTVSNTGILTFVPFLNYYSEAGTVVTITYTIADRDGLSSSPGTITVTVNAVPDAPVAVDDAATTNEDLSITFSLTANDTDADGNNTIALASIDFDTGAGVKTELTVPNEGTYIAGINGTITFTPVPNFNSGSGSATPISYTIKDNTGLTSNPAQIVVKVIPVNDPPTLSNITKPGNQAQTIVFTSADFKSKFTDIEGSTLSKIKVVTLPLFGSLKLYGLLITIGQEILAADLDGITFVPLSAWHGTTNFLWNGQDGAAYSNQNASVIITLNPVNQPPVVSAIIKNIGNTETLSFTTLDFTSRFNDPEANSLSKIQIVSLPSGGSLKLSGTNIIAGQEIPLGEISGITYVPNAGNSGVYSFTWNGSDGALYALAPSTVTITITNGPPVVGDIVKSGTAPTPVSFSITDFTTRFSDPDNNSLVKVKVINLPANGVLSLSGINVFAGQEISLADLPKLTFRPAPNWEGTTTFAWNGFDGSIYALNNAVVRISILLPTDPKAKIGAAKLLYLVRDGINGSYDIKFLLTLVNYGPNGIRNISLQDNLTQAFSGTEFTVKSLAANGNLIINPSYNGNTNTELLLPSSILNGGEQAQVELEINVRLVSRAGLFYNYAFVEGNSVITGAKVQDRSTVGLKPDPVGDGDVNLSELTPVELAQRPTFIPEAFSPNNDGINDYLVIENTLSQKISIEVFNRWGNRIFKALDYKNDWAGQCTEGILLGQDIPDGTYFYILVVDNKNKFVGSLTVQR